MLVISLSNCPYALRGDLTKWLLEINTGVYVGNVNARIREELWQRVRKHANSGRVTMVYSANNEQGLDFRVHNAEWEPINFDGIKLMLRPSTNRIIKQNEASSGFSRAAKMHRARKMNAISSRTREILTRYAVMDIETTGLSLSEHEIIEIAAIIVNEGKIETSFHMLIKCKASVPLTIQELTGITNIMLEQNGYELQEALQMFLQFVGDLPVISHSASFDFNFLRSACAQCNLPLFSNRSIDTLALSRRLIDDVVNYKLSTLISFFNIKSNGAHRSMNDCLATKHLYEKLIELQQADG
jgi:CRISPR-associated protein Cas2